MSPPMTRRPPVPLPDDASIDEFTMPWCFGCGDANPHGLGYRPRIEGDAVVGEIEFAERFQGGPGVTHGGAIAAFVDDLMGYVPMMHRIPAVTANLEVAYRRPVALGKSLVGEAWLVERDGRKLYAEAVCRDESGQISVEATALFITIDKDHFARIAAGDDGAAARLERLQGEGYYP